MKQEYNPEESFGFIHHYEVSNNDLSVASWGRPHTKEERQKIVRENEDTMSKLPPGRQVTLGPVLLAPLLDVSEDAQSG